uniref:Uncharacterized protein n=1 Tax=Molossus molossus TaxID=27622 RepID=A0A7J8J0K9_MOLMO|nr:hypothetical protein HJG59_010417 [Molossus molossus]
MWEGLQHNLDHIQGPRTHHSQRPWPRWSSGWTRPPSSGPRAPLGRPQPRCERRRLRPAAATGPPSPAVRARPSCRRAQAPGASGDPEPPALRPTPPLPNTSRKGQDTGLGAGSRGRAGRAPSRCQPRQSPGKPRGQEAFLSAPAQRPASRCPSGDREGGLGVALGPGGFRGGKIPTWRRLRASEPFERFQGLSPVLVANFTARPVVLGNSVSHLLRTYSVPVFAIMGSIPFNPHNIPVTVVFSLSILHMEKLSLGR